MSENNHYDNMQADYQLRNIGLRSANIAQQELLSVKNSHINELENQIRKLMDQNSYLRNELNKAEFGNIHEIDINRESISECFCYLPEEERLSIATWIAKQKAYKEMCFQFGEKQGLSLKEVVSMKNKLEASVLNGNTPKEHETSATQYPEIMEMKESFLTKGFWRNDLDNGIRSLIPLSKLGQE